MTTDTSKLNEYRRKLSDLRKDRKRKKYPSHTHHSAPHKPLLLLSVVDLFAEGVVDQNQITLTPDLCDVFNDYWRLVMPAGRYGNIAMPFFHLIGEGFWHLIPRAKSEYILKSGRKLRSIRLLHDHTHGAKLDEELFSLLSDSETREKLRATLIEVNFSEEVRQRLVEQGAINVESFKYSRRLLQHARRENSITEQNLSKELPEPVRDHGFRRAVVEAYNHRCAVSGIRILTADHHTAVDAAHIIPWSESHNDDPRNGMALTKLCHWAFENGMITVSPSYQVRLSKELKASNNAPGYLGTLQGRSIHTPEENALSPAPEYLDWHQNKVFRR